MVSGRITGLFGVARQCKRPVINEPSSKCWSGAAPLTGFPCKAANLVGLKRFVLRQMSLVQKIGAAPENSASKAWLRALEMTAKIDATPERIFPVAIEELGARFGGAASAALARRKFQPCGPRCPRQPICPLGAWRRHRQRRHGLSFDAQPGGISCDLAGTEPHRRSGGPDQHPSWRRRAGALHHRRGAQAYYRGYAAGRGAGGPRRPTPLSGGTAPLLRNAFRRCPARRWAKTKNARSRSATRRC